MSNAAYKQLLEQVDSGELVACTISSPWKKGEGSKKIAIRPVKIKGNLYYQISEYDQKKVLHRNLSPKECISFIPQILPVSFRQALFTTTSAIYQILVNRHKEMKVIKKANRSSPLSIAHNRDKKYLLEQETPIPFLIALGIMNKEGKVVPKKYDKFRQINRFVEMIADIAEQLPTDRPIKIVDFGSGKAYLTFALYHYLRNIQKRSVNIVGLDLKKELILQCQKLAQELAWEGLHFQIGDIRDFQTDEQVDLVISLHACDTATDAALEKAIQWNAKVIMCVPCCQHELLSQVSQEALDSLLRHGLLKERFAALVTDAARAELLVMKGYDVQILEFIDMEHTPKNILIRAVKKSSPLKQEQARERYLSFKKLLHIAPYLENSFL